MPLKKLIHKLLEEVDEDIKKAMLAKDGVYETWETVDSPLLTILEWQKLRDNKKD